MAPSRRRARRRSQTAWRAWGSSPAVHEGPGNLEAAAHAAREPVDRVVGAVGERHEPEQLVRAPGGLGPRDVEVARVDQQVLAHRQLQVERRVLGDDAQLALELPRPDVGVDPQHAQLPRVARR